MPWKERNLIVFQNFLNISNILKNGLNEPKTQISLLPRHTQLSPIILSQLGYSLIKIDHKIYHFIADFLLKDAVLMVGVNLRLCLFSLCSDLKKFFRSL